MNAQEIFNALDTAFSNFMVVDMDHMRCDTHMMPADEATYYARHDGARTGRIIAAACDDPGSLLRAVKELVGACGEAVDPIEEVKVPAARMMEYLCCKYQMDEHRPSIRKAYAKACRDELFAKLLEYVKEA